MPEFAIGIDSRSEPTVKCAPQRDAGDEDCHLEKPRQERMAKSNRPAERSTAGPHGDNECHRYWPEGQHAALFGGRHAGSVGEGVVWTSRFAGTYEASVPVRLAIRSHRTDSGAGEPAGVVGSRVAGGHHVVTGSALDAARRRADSGAKGRRRKVMLAGSLASRAHAPLGVRHPQFMFGRGSTAGQSSQRKYDELMRAWRRRNRGLFALLGLLCGAVLVGSFVLSRVFASQAWTSGLVGGMAVAVFLTFRWTGPGWIENWQQGVWGELSTAKALRPLEKAGWVVLHDLPAGRGNVDHIAVGPAGVFLLDSKRLGGSAEIEDGVLTVRRFGDSDLTYTHPGTGHILGLARESHERVKAATRINAWVTPVMVMWGDFPQRRVEGKCVYLHGDELADWLGSRPVRVAPERVSQLAEAVRTAWQPATVNAR